MKYTNGILLYKDKPAYGLLLKLIFMMPLLFLAGSLYYWLSGNIDESLSLLPGAVLLAIIFWLVFPRAYEIYEDHLCIVLGGPFSVKVGFENIKVVRITSRSGFTMNLVTRLSRNYVEIVRKRGFGITITPTDFEIFVENANQAIDQWLKSRAGE
jgi:hypothetical protein